MPVQKLLERDNALRLLAVAQEQAMTGHGRIALVSGEAGIGKTSLVEHFVANHGRGMRVLKGYCDALFTPAPLGPLHDIAHQAGGRLLGQLQGDALRAQLFSCVLDELCDARRPTLFIFEDIHWADEATLDLIRFMARRYTRARGLLVLTWRDDEIGPRHPLRSVLGDRATVREAVRIGLPRLTIDAVRTLLADQPFDARAVYGLTAGNPFFTMEVLSNPGSRLPQTVRDAVLARVVTLGAAGRAALDAAAVVGRPTEHDRLERILGGNAEGLTECIRAGLLETAQNVVGFRHALVREAVLAELDPGRRRDLSRLAFDELKEQGRGRTDAAHLVHLAEGAGDRAAVLEFGPAAARAAVAAGTHQAAAAHYRSVLWAAEDRPAAVRAQFSEAYAEECAVLDDNREAERARRQAVALWEQAEEPAKVGENLAELAGPLVRSGQNAAAEDAIRRSVELLESLPPTRQLAAAYRIRAHMRMLDRDNTVAVDWGMKAIALATRMGDDATVAAAENVVGSALLVDGNEEGRAHLERSLAIARGAGIDSLVALAYTNLGSSYGEQYRFAEAEQHLIEGIAYTAERELEFANHYLRSWFALTQFYRGQWSEAGDIAGALVASSDVSAVSRIMALVALGRVRARRGDPGAATALDEALDLASQTNSLQRLAPVRAARAEMAWLADDRERVKLEAGAVYELAARRRHRWHVGELLFWYWRVGERMAVPKWTALPFCQQIRGDWRRAASSWQSLGCPYEQARALAEGDEPAQIAALETFDRLGAAPAAAALRQRMRQEGRRRIPRGPRATTRRNPFGLTARELEILGCLGEGLSNRRIGARLHVSAKTVDHHVSAVLAKLGAATRGEAASIARDSHLQR